MMIGWRQTGSVLMMVTALGAQAMAEGDSFERYVKTSQDFQSVKQDHDFLLKAYPSWVYMPWYFQWKIGFDQTAARFCVDTGINGAFVDHDDTRQLDWINANKLRFYVDHLAGKGDLHLWDKFPKDKAPLIHGTGMRPRPVNAAMKSKLENLIKTRIAKVKTSPYRAAYALDDELSWGFFVHPCMWQVTDDGAAYQAWLQEVYGPGAPHPTRWISYDEIRPRLAAWSLATFDASPLMDQWSFNDSYWNNFIGDLVSYANSQDPATPCGWVGGQQPSAFGGYDYAKVMRKVQYIEAYNIGDSQAIIRSFNPHNAIPAVTSYFHAGSDEDAVDAAWQAWYYLAQGNRGHIAWVEKWFTDEAKPKPWLKTVAPTYKECSQKIGPLMSGAEWKHDGVAVYYSHASIQLGWIQDAAAHGKTWVQRNGDSRLSCIAQCRKAWLNMLRDEGLQFNFLSYVDLIQSGVPASYKVLILPSTWCLSDAEASEIKAFCRRGGTVIADTLPGLWDQHGKGRATGGALDDLFGLKHNPAMTCKEVFNGNGKLWGETDQDANFNYKSPEQLLTNANTCLRDASGFNKAVRNMSTVAINHVGTGTAVLMNLSPQWYNVYRLQGAGAAAKRSVFMKPIHDAGVTRWVQIKNAGAKEFGYELTYWTQGARTILFLIANKDVEATDLGGGAAVGLKEDTIPITLAFAKAVRNVKNERTGTPLGSGREFPLTWKQNEACVISFEAD